MPSFPLMYGSDITTRNNDHINSLLHQTLAMLASSQTVGEDEACITLSLGLDKTFWSCWPCWQACSSTRKAELDTERNNLETVYVRVCNINSKIYVKHKRVSVQRSVSKRGHMHYWGFLVLQAKPSGLRFPTDVRLCCRTPPSKFCSDSTLGSNSPFGNPIAFSGDQFFFKLDYINRCLCSVINDAAAAKHYKE